MPHRRCTSGPTNREPDITPRFIAARLLLVSSLIATPGFIPGSLANDFGDAPSGYGDAAHQTADATLIETVAVPGANQDWTTVSFAGSYVDPTVVCTPNLQLNTDLPVVVRIRDITATGFEVRLQFPEEPIAIPFTAVAPTDVYCIAAEQGVWELTGGLRFTAGEVVSNGLNGEAVDNWNTGNTENITGGLGRTYTNPVVLGQVVTSNDDAFSTFWSNDCTSRTNPPDTDGICIGKHVGEASATSTRAAETLGYLVIESGSGNVVGYDFEAGLGPDTVRGVGNAPPYFYSTGLVIDGLAVSQSAMDGGDGSWGILFGNSPVTLTPGFNAAVDEDTISDGERSHTTEQLGYLVFGNGNATPAEGGIRITATPYLGSVPGDSELGSLSNSSATGDDFNAPVNDEDGVGVGVTRVDPTRVELTASIVVNNPTASDSTLCAWLDGAGEFGLVDGDFTDTGEGQCQTIAAGLSESRNVTWRIPDGTSFNSFVRVRIAPQSEGLTIATPATVDVTGGEVEDHAISVTLPPPPGKDYGDAPLLNYGEASHAQQTVLETLTIENYSDTSTTIALKGTYVDPIVACVFQLPSSTDIESIVRVSNITTKTFDLKVQSPPNLPGTSGSRVNCLVAESGVHTLADGTIFEAGTVLSTATNGNTNWDTALQEPIFPAHSFLNPTVLGQVITENDARFSAFWSSDCASVNNPPDAAGICVGKHVAEDSVTTRADETLGYIIVESGTTGRVNRVDFEAAVGPNSIEGVEEAPSIYSLGGSTYNHAVATITTMNGNNGGWAVLFGANPILGNQINLAIDEDTIGDTDRSHIGERVAYWVFSEGDAVLIDEPWLGSLRGDLESEYPPISAGTNDDDSDTSPRGLGDDEDGVSFAVVGEKSIAATVTVSNPAASAATVCAWLDRPDTGSVGVFEAGDQADAIVGGLLSVPGCAAIAADSYNVPVVFTWDDFPDTVFNTYARFRVSTDIAAASSTTGTAPDGEVEDYPVSAVFTPNAVTIGAVGAELQRIDDLLVGSSGESEALLALLRSWSPSAAAAASSGAVEQVNDAVRSYLDPDGDGYTVVIHWETLEERLTVGFYVERRTQQGRWSRVNDRLLPGLITAPLGGEYRLIDPGAPTGQTVQYRLIELEGTGVQRRYGPFDIDVPARQQAMK